MNRRHRPRLMLALAATFVGMPLTPAHAADYFLIDSAYIGQSGTLSFLAPVPEPATLLPVLASLLLTRRCRRS